MPQCFMCNSRTAIAQQPHCHSSVTKRSSASQFFRSAVNQRGPRHTDSITLFHSQIMIGQKRPNHISRIVRGQQGQIQCEATANRFCQTRIMSHMPSTVTGHLTIGDSIGCKNIKHNGPKFSHSHAIFRKILQICMLAPPSPGLVPRPMENPGSAPDSRTIVHVICSIVDLFDFRQYNIKYITLYYEIVIVIFFGDVVPFANPPIISGTQPEINSPPL